VDSIELQCLVKPNSAENLEILSAMLSGIGFESFLETQTGINAYISAEKFLLEEVINLKENFELFKFTFSFQRIKDKNWNEVWEQNYFKPIVIADKCVIRASFHKDFPELPHEIIIDPKTAFGTGNHATTFLIIEEIFKLELANKTVLDLGCGTAILAILSKKLNSGKILAIDNDEKAIINSGDNIQANDVEDIDLLTGTAKNIGEKYFDIIFENIWKNIVIGDMPITFKALNPGGIIIFSGFYEEDIEEVKTAAKQQGFIFNTQSVKDKWAVLTFTKEYEKSKYNDSENPLNSNV